MQAPTLNYELCTDLNTEEPPYCPHGPTLLFVKSNVNGNSERFYACASCRSRKDCSFYQTFSKNDTAEKTALRKQIYEQGLEINKHFIFYEERLHKRQQFCVKCDVFLPSDLCNKAAHQRQCKKLTAEDIKYPSRWIKPKESSKTNAQYFFSTEVIDFVSNVVTEHEVDKVLCIGTPSIHEHLKNATRESQIQSFLLDIDVRMRQFHTEFAHYNMFNHHFYNALEPDGYTKFVQNCRHLMVIIDPPYGGLLAALNLTLAKISAATSGKVTTLMFLPYFMEPQVIKQLPGLAMSDYKVNYCNHSGFKGGSTGKARGSPARIFTDIPLQEFVLPGDQGYRYCEKCKRYVSKENTHCEPCGSCTTKDGPTYNHCDICGRCVKPTRTHCPDCNQCEFISHICNDSNKRPEGSSRRSASNMQKINNDRQMKRHAVLKQAHKKRRK